MGVELQKQQEELKNLNCKSNPADPACSYGEGTAEAVQKLPENG